MANGLKRVIINSPPVGQTPKFPETFTLRPVVDGNSGRNSSGITLGVNEENQRPEINTRPEGTESA
jgi:hypothetical protein